MPCRLLLSISTIWFATSAAAGVAVGSSSLKGLRIQGGSVHELALPATRAAFDLTVEHDGVPISLALVPRDIRAPDFELIEDDGIARSRREPPPPATYAGTAYAPGRKTGRVAASIRGGSLRATILFEGGPRLYIQPLADAHDGAAAAAHVVYTDGDLVKGDERCAVLAPTSAPPTGPHAAVAADAKVARVAIEADTFYFAQGGSSLAATLLDVEDVLNGVCAIYEQEVSITYELSKLVVQTGATDQYSATKHEKLLKQFRSRWNDDFSSVKRDTAHLMTGRDVQTNVVGLAFLGVVCDQDFAYGFSETTFTSNYAMRVALTAHELGHNWNATHCDGQPDCSIMCSVLGQCSGVIDAFGSGAESEIVPFAASAGCIKSVKPTVAAPLHETFPKNKLDSKLWQKWGGAKVVTKARGETSGKRSAQLDATKKGLPDVLYSRTFDTTPPSSPALAFYVQHRGVESSESLSIEYRDANGVWNFLASVVSDGVDQATFESRTIALPPAAIHDCVRFRFKANVDEADDDWYLDDVRIEESPAPPAAAEIDGSGIVPLRFAFAEGSTTPANQAISIKNGGAAGQALPWTATITQGGAFLQASAASGTVLPGETEDLVSITADPSGLTAGLHLGSVRIANTDAGGDFVDVPVSVAIHSATWFEPGDTLRGTIDAPGETDEAATTGIQGAKLRLDVVVTSGALKPVVRLFDAQGALLKQKKVKLKKGAGKAAFKLKATGVFRIEVGGDGDTTGGYEIATSLIAPKIGSQHTVKLAPKTAGGTVERLVAGMPGTVSNITIAPIPDDKGPFTAALGDPAGAALGLAPFAEPLPTGGVILRGVPLPTGRSTLTISGFAAKEKVAVTLEPFHPSGSSIVDL